MKIELHQYDRPDDPPPQRDPEDLIGVALAGLALFTTDRGNRDRIREARGCHYCRPHRGCNRNRHRPRPDRGKNPRRRP